MGAPDVWDALRFVRVRGYDTVHESRAAVSSICATLADVAGWAAVHPYDMRRREDRAAVSYLAHQLEDAAAALRHQVELDSERK